MRVGDPSSASSECQSRITGWRLVRTHAADAARVLPRRREARALGAPLLTGPPGMRQRQLGAVASRSRIPGGIAPFRKKGTSALTKRLDVRVSPEEKDQLRAIAERAEMPVAEIVRLRAMGRPVVARTDATTIR